jgi:hypothetical protein
MRTRVFLLVAALCVTGLIASVGYAAGGDNSDAAHACQQDGYLSLHRSDGSGFENAGECVSYAAQGGQFQTPIPPCTVDPANNVGCLTLDNATIPLESTTSSLIGGSTLTLNAVYSVDTTYSGPFPLTNSLATGGGTYVIKDSHGHILDQGTLTANGGFQEGLVSATFADSDGHLTTCPAAAIRAVEIYASASNASGSFIMSQAAYTLTADPSAGQVTAGGASSAWGGGAVWRGTVGSAVTLSC